MKKLVVNLAFIGAAGLSASALATGDMGGVKIGMEYRAEVSNNDNKLTKTTNDDATATTMMWSRFKFKSKFMLNDRTKFKLRVNVTDKEVEKAYVHHMINDMISFSFGKMKIMQGGVDIKKQEYDSFIHSLYGGSATGANHRSPFDLYGEALALHYTGFGKVSLQLVNDVVDSGDGTYKNTANKQPAWILQYTGDFNGVKPLFQYGVYDSGNSSFWSLGVCYKMAGLMASLGYTSDSRKNFMTAAEETDTTSVMSFDVSYQVGDMIEPFLSLRQSDVKQGGTDVEHNTANVYNDSGVGTTMTDDNQMSWVVGTYFAKHEDKFRPYFAIVGSSAKFQDVADMTKTETRSDMSIKLGVNGTF